MKRLILASLMLATPALAQQPSAPPGQKALEIMLNREMGAHQADLGAALQLSDQVDALKKQVADLTAENTKLKAPVPAEPAK
jgi:polyhydroxyalkanoate synthesis regulator phasin